MSHKSLAAVWTLGSLIIAISACSRSQQDDTTTKFGSVNDPPSSYKVYNASSLVEIRDIADLPEALRSKLLRGDMARGGEGPGGRCCEFILGGVSPTSAVVAYELFGFVSMYQAAAFVQSESGWIEAGQWNIGTVSSLEGLKEMTNRPPDYWGHAR
jgi:hypothetical protein